MAIQDKKETAYFMQKGSYTLPDDNFLA